MEVKLRRLLLLLIGCPSALAAQSDGPARVIVADAMQSAATGTLDAFRQRWERSAASADPRLVALALGSAARFDYRFPEAIRLLRIAEGDTTKTDALSARAALGRATIEMQRFNLPDANVLLLRAGRVAASTGSPDVLAETLILLVPLRQRMDGVAAALATADSAARLLRPDDALQRTELACRRAQVHVRAGDPSALDAALAGATAAARLAAPRIEGLCWQAAGQARHMRDEFREAADAFGRAAERHAAGRDQSGLSASLQWRGFFHRLLGEFDSAQTDFRRAVIAGNTSGNRSPVAWAWLGLSGLSLAAAEPVRAADEAQRGGVALAELGDRWGLAAASNLAGTAAHQLGDLPRAKLRFLEAITRSQALGAISDELDSGLHLIDIERELDGEPAALARMAWLDTIARRTGNVSWAKERLYHLGLLALRRGDGNAAVMYFQRFQTAVGRREMAALPGFDFAVRFAEAHSMAGDPVRGARMLDSAIERFAAWRERISDRALRLAVWEERSIDPDPDLGIATIIARTAAAGHDTLALRLADARRTRDLRGQVSHGAVRPPGAGELYLQFVTGRRGEPTTLFVRRGATLRSAALAPIDSLARKIAALRSLFTGNAPAGELSRELGAMLLGPALAGVDSTVTKLVIVPDGALHGVPWSALTMPDGRLVLERFSVTVLPSGAFPPERRVTRSRSVVAIGVDDGAALWEGQRLATLVRAPREARLVANTSPGGHAITGADATERAVKQLAGAPPAILHIAAHAIVDERSASRAAIVLRAGGGEDGLLEASELAAMNMPVELIVLSGCSTASGRVLAAEGVQGLVRPLLDAGAHAVIASQWAASDESAEKIMEWFYMELALSETTADALRHAQLRARRAGLPPGDRAGWSYVGDPAAKVSTVLTVPRDDRLRLAMVAFATATGVLALIWLYRTTSRRVALRT